MVFAFLLLLAMAPVQSGAAGNPPLRGTVRDQTGAVLPAARVDVADESGVVVQTAATDSRGAFSITGLAAGTYELRTAFEGFRPATVRVRMPARGSPPAQTIVLQLASVPQEVTVSGGVTTAANANKDALVLDDHALKDLPVFDNDIVGTLSRMLDASAMGTGGVTLVVDGMEARKAGVSPSAIAQVKVNSDPYSAEFPRPGRGRIEIITKAGTDAYSGEANFTFRDAHLNARDPFAARRPPEQRRIYEGVLGGPVGDGKRASFLLTLERRDEDAQGIVFAAGPQGHVDQIVATPDRSLEASGSITRQLGKNHTLQVRFTGENSDSRNQGVGGLTLPESGVDDRGDEEQIVIGTRSMFGKRLLSEFRLLAGREIGSAVSLTSAPHLVVLDAFSGGGAQADQATTEYHVQLSQALTYARGRQVIKTGFAIPDFSRRGFDDRTNTLGTFTFGSLDAYAAGRPLSFLQQRGDGRIVFLQKVFGAFVQDQIALGDRLSITPGVRYDWQNVFADNNNFAPRVSVAYALTPTTIVRGGGGVFYDRAGDSAIREVLRSRQNMLVRDLILDPGYPDPFSNGVPGAVPAPSIVTLASGIRTPFTAQYGVGVERQVHKGTTIAVNYLGSRGVDLFRSRDVNAPAPPLYLTRPDVAFGQIRQIESTGRQTSHSIQLVARGRLSPKIQGSVQYTLATAHNDTSGINALPANSYDLASEWGPAGFDQRHHFEALLNFKANDWANVGLAISLASGRPYSLLTGTDDFNTGQTNARPAGVARNSLEGPGSASVDLRWTREFAKFTIGVDAFNVLNHVNYTSYIGTITSPFFGQPVAARPPRRVQLSAGFHF